MRTKYSDLTRPQIEQEYHTAAHKNLHKRDEGATK